MRVLAAVAVMASGCAAGSVSAPAVVASAPAVGNHIAVASDAARRAPLAGIVIGIDPGHNGHNYAAPAYINRPVWDGREHKPCDTTGTETNAGYPEPRFTFRVARRLAHELRRNGATVVMTREDNNGVGPCVNRRARILNQAHAAVALDIHADGGPAAGRGFAILEPARTDVNRHVVAASARFGRVIKHELLAKTPMPVSTYDGRNGIAVRNDLAGLNLAKQPKVLIECGNMRNARDARLLTSRHFQHRLAVAFTAAVIRYLRKYS
jgi:N-acetylmuramoyl-L-alanine amidase